jgi:hypothetical protein
MLQVYTALCIACKQACFLHYTYDEAKCVLSTCLTSVILTGSICSFDKFSTCKASAVLILLVLVISFACCCVPVFASARNEEHKSDKSQSVRIVSMKQTDEDNLILLQAT